MNNQQPSAPAKSLHLMAKPAGPVCNLDCSYCFYLEKEQFFPKNQRFLMNDSVLRAYIAQNIEQESSPEVVFTWQGGEPMLPGLAFFKQAVAYQKALAGDKNIRNSLQTNGVLLNDEWCEFLAQEHFMVGISLDGPKEIHDQARVDKKGRGTFDVVLRGIALLKKYAIEFNVLVTVSETVSKHPKAVYRFMKEQGITHLQFNPVVERLPSTADSTSSQTFASPPKIDMAEAHLTVSPHSVTPEAYGDFLIAIFDEWVRNDVGKVYVMNFEWALAAWLKLPSTICLFAKECGRALIVEHNGDVYSCDHFMYPDYRLGNLQQHDIGQMANSTQQIAFGAAKATALPDYCRQCEYLFACNGECPKNRFVSTLEGEAGLNYLCPSYKKYFRHIDRYMKVMAQLISYGQPAALIMDAFNGPLAVKLRH